MGNDTITTGHETDWVWTQGGADTITLGGTLAYHQEQVIVLADTFDGDSFSGLVPLFGVYDNPTFPFGNTYETITEEVSSSDTVYGNMDFWQVEKYSGGVFTALTVSGGFSSTDLLAMQGFWGVAPGGTAVDLTQSQSFGTSADMSVIHNFNVGPAGDQLVIVPNAWENDGLSTVTNYSGHSTSSPTVTDYYSSGPNAGLVQAGLSWATSGQFGHSSIELYSVVSGAATQIETVASGGIAGLGHDATANVTELVGATFANAAAVAGALQSDTFDILTAAGVPGTKGESADFIIAYQDTAGNVRIADLNLVYNGSMAAGPVLSAETPPGYNGIPPTPTIPVVAGDVGINSTVHVSDMAELVGVTLSSLNVHDIVFA